MKKYIYLLVLLLTSAMLLQAQQYPKSIGYSNRNIVKVKGDPEIGGVSFSGATPFASQWRQEAFGDGKITSLMAGMRHNILFAKRTFKNQLFASKGYFGDYIELRWKVANNSEGISEFKIYRRKLGSNTRFKEVTTLASDDRSWKDEYAESGVMYEYRIKAEGLFPGEHEFINYTDGIGYRIPYGQISGRVTYKGGAAVEGVSIIAETEDKLQGKGIYLNGTNAYLAISPKLDDPLFKLDTAMTLQMWVRPYQTPDNAVLFQKGDQYQLTYSHGLMKFKAGSQVLDLDFKMRPDTFFQVIAMKTHSNNNKDSLKLIVLYNDKDYYVAKALFTDDLTANNDDIKIGYDGTSHYFKGYLDELRIWHRSFSEKKIIEQSGGYISGNEEYLSGYYRMDEGVGLAFYDLSHRGFEFNENHGYKHATAEWSDIVPAPNQLTVKGTTDKNGNYIISGIPYATDGSTYRFVPAYGVHSFEPTEQMLFMGEGASIHSNINFTDVASFSVKGFAYYKNTKFPVEGVNVKIDGKTAVSSDGTPITTDKNGKFEVDVPIGKHYIQLEKYKHGFEQDGRFPRKEGELFDFQADYTFQQSFFDTTLIKVIGKVVGGPVQGGKPKGLGKSKNNIGNATISLTTQKGYDLCKSPEEGKWNNLMYRENKVKDQGDTKFSVNENIIQIEADHNSGEFCAYLLPEKYVIKNIQAGQYTFPDEFKKVINLSSSFFFQTESDTVIVGEPIITVDNDTLYDYRIDSVQYQYNLDLVYRELPKITVLNAKDNTPVFWETKTKVKNGKVAEEVELTESDGTPLTDFPIIKQRNRYNLKISVFEEYFNDDLDPNHENPDKVPVVDGKVEIKNALAIETATQLFKIKNNGTVNYNFIGGLANVVAPYTNTMEITAYTGKKGSVQTKWKYNQAGHNPYTGTFKAYVLGGRPTGSNFVTTGPNKIDMILRDPPGSNSYAYQEKGTNHVHTVTNTVTNENHESLQTELSFGQKAATFVGLGAGVITEASTVVDVNVGIEHRESWVDGNTKVITNNSLKKWQTSAEPDYVGACGDLFIGHSTNIVYGKTLVVNLLPIDKGEGHEGATINGKYRIGKDIGIRVSPEFNTAFQYTQNHIENYLIPNLITLRNNFLEKNFETPLSRDHVNYGKNNPSQDTIKDGKIVTEILGKYYSYVIPEEYRNPDTMYVDSVRFYNQAIAGWEKVLARNEREKIEAKYEDNLSFDAGAVYESSITYDTSDTDIDNFQWQIAPSIGAKKGFEIAGVGINVNLQAEYNRVKVHDVSDETSDPVTTGFVLSDNDEGDYFSVDIKKPSSKTGVVFVTKGGQSQCPYEGEEITKYYKPGTVISVATEQREDPQIACEAPTQINVPEDQPALFKIDLRNASSTNDEAWYALSIDEASNQNGAAIKMDGTAINNGRMIYIDAGEQIHKIISIEKTDPAINDYEDIGIILHSVCQYDPGDNWKDIADTVKLTARFKPVCSKVEITSPKDKWVVNSKATPEKTLNVKIDNYNLAHTGFEKIIFQYRPTSTSDWTGTRSFYVNADDYNNAGSSEDKALIEDGSGFNYQFSLGALSDRSYEIRAITTCANGTSNESPVLSGIRDIKCPQVFGTPQPGNGILKQGDNIMVTFDEPIETGLLNETNFSVRGVPNGSKLRHNCALYFDGNDDYASAIAGANLQNKSFAIEFWTKRGNLNQGTIFSQGDIELGFNSSNQFYVKMGKNQQATSHVYDFTDRWIHFTLSYDYTVKEINVYSAHDASPEQHNDIEIADLSFSKPYIGNGRMNIGTNSDKSNYYNGFIHDFRVWEKTIGKGTATSNMVKNMNGDEIGLSGMWPMNEARGEYAIDLSRRHNAQINGATWKVFPAGYAEIFNGISSNLEIPTGTVVITDEMDMTLEFWFNANADQTNTVMFSNGIGNGTDGMEARDDIWNIGFNEFGELYAKNQESAITIKNENYTDDSWHHFALVLNRNGNTSIFIDGSLKKYLQSSNFGGLKGANMTIGAKRNYVDGTTSDYFKGKIDEFRIWKLARTKKLLNMDMNSKLSGKEIGLMAYYPFEKYDADLILRHSLENCDYDDNTNQLTNLFATDDGTTSTNINVPNIKDARPTKKLSVKWVATEDQIILNINEPATSIEKCVLEITAQDIKDLHGNTLESPVTWTAYVSKNTVIWDEQQLNFEKKENTPLAFDVKIINTSGNKQNYTITNLPQWLHVDLAEGTLNPDSYTMVHFTVDENINVGKYDESIYLTSDFGYDEKLSLNLKVFRTPPDWKVNPEEYEFSMSVIGQVKIDGIFSTNTDDKVAAFINGECRGVGQVQYFKDYDMFEVFLNIYSNIDNGEDVIFKIWNATEGIVHENVSPELEFKHNQIHGITSNPIILETNNSYTRAIPLTDGWRWVSFNLDDPDLTNLNDLFKNVISSQESQVKGIDEFATFDKYGWTGSLVNNGGFNTSNMYMIKSVTDQILTIKGAKINPLETPINLYPNWSWIGYTPQNKIEVNDALANINPSPQDLIKSQYEFAMYDPAMGWLGSLTFLKPGEGYMYFSNNTENTTLVYPQTSVAKNASRLVRETTKVDAWNLDSDSYLYNMSIVGELHNPNKEVSENDVVGAFVNGECRGIARPVKIGNDFLHFITIYSNTANETVTLKVIDTLTNKVADIEEQFTFVPNKITGNLASKQPLNVRASSATNEIAQTEIRVYPNPSSGKVFIDLADFSNIQNSNIEVTDVSGKVLIRKSCKSTSNEIDLSAFPKGLYFVKVYTKKSIIVEKLILN